MHISHVFRSPHSHQSQGVLRRLPCNQAAFLDLTKLFEVV